MTMIMDSGARWFRLDSQLYHLITVILHKLHNFSVPGFPHL